MRWNEYCVLKARSADPVLTGAIVSRSLAIASHSLQQNGVGFFQKAIGQWQLFQRHKRMIHGLHVVLYLLPVIALFRADLLYIHQVLIHLGLSALDTARS